MLCALFSLRFIGNITLLLVIMAFMGG